MAKYIYTHGKRQGKVYQEYYYTLNGQQIVQKKNFYCPVNTKWLSRPEFKDYVLSLIQDGLWEVRVTPFNPAKIVNNTLFFVGSNKKYDIIIDKDDKRTEIPFYSFLKGFRVLGYIFSADGSVTVTAPSSNCALFYLNTHAAEFHLVEIGVNPIADYRKVSTIIRTHSAYNLPTVTRINDTELTIKANGACRAVIFTFNTKIS